MANKILSVDTVARGLIAKLRPHIAHQKEWANNDVGLHCNWCGVDFMDAVDFGHVRYLTLKQQGQVREAVAKWIFYSSGAEAQLFFRV